jgi:hypothetical protein
MRTFVIRLQDDRMSDAEPYTLRGVADEIANGRRVAFTSGEELLSVLAPPPSDPTSSPTPSTLHHREDNRDANN